MGVQQEGLGKRAAVNEVFADAVAGSGTAASGAWPPSLRLLRLHNLKGGIVTAGKDWSDDGAVHETHSLKRRSAKTTRPVPTPPVLVRMLIEHIARFGVAADGRIFRNAAGNYIDAAAYGITWGRAREAILTHGRTC